MKYKRPMTAADFMAKLDADPDFQRRKSEKEEKWAQRRAAVDEMLRPILDDLRSMGITAGSIEEVTQRYAPLPSEIVEVLLRWLPRVQDDRIKESLIRSLGTAREPFDGRPLVESFLHDTSETLRWPIANTMAEARPFGIVDWLVGAVKNRSFGSARGMLMLAMARLAPAETSLPALLSVLDQLPGHVAVALGEVGGATELDALRSRVGNVQGWEKAELLKAIRKIDNRSRQSAWTTKRTKRGRSPRS